MENVVDKMIREYSLNNKLSAVYCLKGDYEKEDFYENLAYDLYKKILDHISYEEFKKRLNKLLVY